MAPGLGQQKLALFPLRRSPTPTWHPDTQRPPPAEPGANSGVLVGGLSILLGCRGSEEQPRGQHPVPSGLVPADLPSPQPAVATCSSWSQVNGTSAPRSGLV